MIRRLTRREQGISILCIVMAGVYVIYSFLVKPMIVNLATLDDQIIVQSRRLDKDTMEIGRARASEETIALFEKKFKQIRSNEETISSLLAEIEVVANQLQLQITNLTPQRVQEGESYKHFLINLTIDGDFMNILQFVHILQGEGHLLEVQEARFDKGMRSHETFVQATLVLKKTFLS